MAKKALPVFTRNHWTGSMEEFLADETQHLSLVPDESKLPPLRVLVADRNERERLLTINHLGRMWPGKRDLLVECAADGLEALEIIRRVRFELIMLDCNILYHDGPEVLRAMRGDGLRIPLVVIVSGQSQETIAADLESMAGIFVQKNNLQPIDFSGSNVVTNELLAECS